MVALAFVMVFAFLIHMFADLELRSAARENRKPFFLTRAAYITSGLCFALLLLFFALAVVALLKKAGLAT
jgi:hypothetical protein